MVQPGTGFLRPYFYSPNPVKSLLMLCAGGDDRPAVCAGSTSAPTASRPEGRPKYCGPLAAFKAAVSSSRTRLACSGRRPAICPVLKNASSPLWRNERVTNCKALIYKGGHRTQRTGRGLQSPYGLMRLHRDRLHFEPFGVPGQHRIQGHHPLCLGLHGRRKVQGIARTQACGCIHG